MNDVAAILASAVGLWSAATLYAAVASRTESRIAQRAAAMMSLGLAFGVALGVWFVATLLGIVVPLGAMLYYLLVAIGAVVLMDVVYFTPDVTRHKAEASTSEAP